VFTEDLVSPAIAKTLASEAGVQTDVLSTLEALTPQAADAGDDYLDVMRANLAAISAGLRCS
jgi:zinc transport system substrate-binding protein